MLFYPFEKQLYTPFFTVRFRYYQCIGREIICQKYKLSVLHRNNGFHEFFRYKALLLRFGNHYGGKFLENSVISLCIRSRDSGNFQSPNGKIYWNEHPSKCTNHVNYRSLTVVKTTFSVADSNRKSPEYLTKNRLLISDFIINATLMILS
jgi:hypothetical protein